MINLILRDKSFSNVSQHNYYHTTMEESSERIDTRLLPMLTKYNWNTEFKDAYRELALTYGKAGEIIIRGVDIVMTEPRRDMVREEIIDGIPVPIEGGNRMFPDNERGDRLFEQYERRYSALKEGKKKLISKLLMSMDKEVKNSLTTSPGYRDAYDHFDLLRIYNMTEQVVLGRGAISIYSLIVRLLKCKQGESYNQYDKEFKDNVHDLMAQGGADEILLKIFNALFIIGVDQEQFKDKLTHIYGERDWPSYIDLSAELHTYAESTERMKDLKKTSNDGIINANISKVENSRGCWNCGSTAHRRMDCDKPNTRCNKCGKWGHMEKFCKGTYRTQDRNSDIQKKRYSGTIRRKKRQTKGLYKSQRR